MQRAVATVGLALLLPAANAAAHGPCGCTFPAAFAKPGQQVRTGTAYKVIWNPSPRDFRNQTTPTDLVSGYRADAPSETVLNGSYRRPQRLATFRVPLATPPGIFFVLIFDGSEGGQHTTWDYVQVAGPPPDSGDADELDLLPLVLAAGAGIGLGGLAAALLLRRRRD